MGYIWSDLICNTDSIKTNFNLDYLYKGEHQGCLIADSIKTNFNKIYFRNI